MRPTALAFVASLLLSSGCFAQSTAGRFVPAYTPISNPNHQRLAQSMRERQVLEGMAAGLSRDIALPANVPIVLAECREENAFYMPDKKAIKICIELVSRLVRDIPRQFARAASQDEIGTMISGALLFIVLHEVGHALIHIYNVPVLGREEDAADQISAFFVLKTQRAPQAMAASAWFFSRNGTIFSQRHLADEHSLGAQRKYNLFCWAYGSNPQRYEYLVKGGALPVERARRCPHEYHELNEAVMRLLGAKLKRVAGGH